MEQKTPLGYIVLESGAKEIYPMNDFLTNFTYENPKNWEALRLTVNTVYEAYLQKHLTAIAITLIEGDIHVETQYSYYLKPKKTKRQDIRLDELRSKILTFLELQNRANTTPPIWAQALDYFALGISRSDSKMANQVWLLAEDVPNVLHGEIFAHYILMEETSCKPYPNTSGILFVSLPKLSQEEGPAGELAAFLLGKLKEPKDKTVKEIAKVVKASFDAFKIDKEVKRTMTVAEKYKNEGIVEGIAKGITEGIAQGIIQGIAQGITQGITEGVAQGITQGLAQGKAEGKAEGTTNGIFLATDKIQEFVNSGLSLADALERVRNIANGSDATPTPVA